MKPILAKLTPTGAHLHYDNGSGGLGTRTFRDWASLQDTAKARGWCRTPILAVDLLTRGVDACEQFVVHGPMVGLAGERFEPASLIRAFHIVEPAEYILEAQRHGHVVGTFSAERGFTPDNVIEYPEEEQLELF